MSYQRDLPLREWKWVASSDLQWLLVHEPGNNTPTDEMMHLQLPLNKVEASDHLRDRMLDL